jgi:hypothetical protein
MRIKMPPKRSEIIRDGIKINIHPRIAGMPNPLQGKSPLNELFSLLRLGIPDVNEFKKKSPGRASRSPSLFVIFLVWPAPTGQD